VLARLLADGVRRDRGKRTANRDPRGAALLRQSRRDGYSMETLSSSEDPRKRLDASSNRSSDGRRWIDPNWPTTNLLALPILYRRPCRALSVSRETVLSTLLWSSYLRRCPPPAPRRYFCLWRPTVGGRQDLSFLVRDLAASLQLVAGDSCSLLLMRPAPSPAFLLAPHDPRFGTTIPNSRRSAGDRNPPRPPIASVKTL